MPINGHFSAGIWKSARPPGHALQRELFKELEWRPEGGRFLYQWSNPDYPFCIHFFVVSFEGDRNQLVFHQRQNCDGSVLKRWYRKAKWHHTFLCMCIVPVKHMPGRSKVSKSRATSSYNKVLYSTVINENSRGRICPPLMNRLRKRGPVNSVL
jgi:hypothetical protein